MGAAMMVAPELILWRERMKYRKGEAADALGLSPNSYRAYEEGRSEIPRYVALSCAAVEAGLRAIGDEVPSVREGGPLDVRANVADDGEGWRK